MQAALHFVQFAKRVSLIVRGSIKRCASAVGEGAMAVTLVHRYLAQG